MAEDTRQEKRASFSAIGEHNTNGRMPRTSIVASGKTGASKKLVIKNFKGTLANHFKYTVIWLSLHVLWSCWLCCLCLTRNCAYILRYILSINVFWTCNGVNILYFRSLSYKTLKYSLIVCLFHCCNCNRSAQNSRELHWGHMAEATRSSQCNSKQYFHQIQSGGTLSGLYLPFSLCSS